MERIRFAVLGYGHIGTRHADMIAANGECELVAVIDTDLTLNDKVVKELGVPFFNSLKDYIESGIETDVINIATPNALHAEQAMDCLTAGWHVVIEKPMALTSGDSKAILDYANTNHKQVFCVMQNRYSPPMQWLKKILKDNVLGEIYMVNVNCYWNRDEQYYNDYTWHGKADVDGGTLFTQFSHYIDLLYWLFGGMADIKARFANYNHKEMIEFEDTASVSFSFEEGGHGTLNYSTSVWDKNMESTMVVVAEHGTVKIGGQYMNSIEYCHIKDYQLEKNATEKSLTVGKYEGARANHHYVIQNVVDVLKERSEEITTNASEGLKVVEIIENIYALKN